MINQRAVENAELYTYGEWISPTLDPSIFLLPADEDNWGLLTWTEQFTTITGDGLGHVRIDILDSSSNVLEEDFFFQENGIDLNSYSTISDNQIKIRVKLYGLNEPLPIVSMIHLRAKNGGNYSMFTKEGIMTFIERAVKTSPTRTLIDTFATGTGTTTPTINDASLTTSVFSDSLDSETTYTEDATNLTMKIRGTLDTAEANGNSLTEAGLLNDALCSHEVWTPAISKDGSTTLTFIWTILGENG